ncbi:MAG TPA: DUF2059 domain-containing protein [Allosphingosinicella sp.]|nr:DUF2059 domain-containing protein [Allosphingosinicella sp.]
MRALAFAALLAGLSGPALVAQPPVAPPAPPRVAEGPTRPDAARLAAAGRLVDLLMPPGSMRAFMDGIMPNDETMLASVAERLGIDTTDMTHEQRVRAVEEQGLRADPQFRERFRIMMEVTRRVAGEVMTELEPEMRAVMTTLMARQFSVGDLGELESFFRTPAGRRYAQLSLTMMRDPAWQEFFALMTPRLAQMQQRLTTEMNAATAHLDPAPHS